MYLFCFISVPSSLTTTQAGSLASVQVSCTASTEPQVTLPLGDGQQQDNALVESLYFHGLDQKITINRGRTLMFRVVHISILQYVSVLLHFSCNSTDDFVRGLLCRCRGSSHHQCAVREGSEFEHWGGHVDAARLQSRFNVVACIRGIRSVVKQFGSIQKSYSHGPC